MKIKILDEVLKNDNLKINKVYSVLKTEAVNDDMYYIVLNENKEKVPVHELLVKVINN